MWNAVLKGRYVVPARVVLLVNPTVTWLKHEDRHEEAARLIAAAPMAFANTTFTMWEPIGEVARSQHLAEGLDVAGVADQPATLDELLWQIAAMFRPSINEHDVGGAALG